MSRRMSLYSEPDSDASESSSEPSSSAGGGDHHGLAAATSDSDDSSSLWSLKDLPRFATQGSAMNGNGGEGRDLPRFATQGSAMNGGGRGGTVNGDGNDGGVQGRPVSGDEAGEAGPPGDACACMRHAFTEKAAATLAPSEQQMF